jgi:Flp pilus assembly protein TadG
MRRRAISPTGGKQRHRQRGLALVEAAIAIPIVLLLLIPVAEIVRAFVQLSTLSHQTRSAVRYLAENAVSDTTGVPVLTADLIAKARNLVVYGSPDGGTTPAFPGLTTSEVMTPVITSEGNISLTVTHPYQSLLQLGGRLPGFGYGADMTLKNLPLTVTYSMRPL